MTKRTLGVIDERPGAVVPDEDSVGRVVALGRALSDPIRVRMLGGWA